MKTLILLLLLLHSVCGVSFSPYRYTSTTIHPTMDGAYVWDAGDFVTYWTYDEANNLLTTKMCARCNGWISFGWSDEPKMGPADMAVGWVEGSTEGKDTASTILLDSWSPNYDQPSLDVEKSGGRQSYQLLAASQSGGWTNITFSRLLVNNDPWDFQFFPYQSRINGMYAYAPGNGDVNTGYYPKHSNWGMAVINFRTGHVHSLGSFTPGILVVIVFGALLLIWAGIVWASVLSGKRSKKTKAGTAVVNDVGLEEIPIDAEIDIPFDSKISSFRRISLWLSAASEHRIPFTHFPLGPTLIALAFVGFNVASVFILSYFYALGWGSLISVGTFFVVMFATRNSLLGWLLRFPWDKTIMFHKWLGRLLLVWVLLHSVWYIVIWSQDRVSLQTKFSEPHIIYGVIAAFAVLLISLTSPSFIRRAWYEAFYYPHLALFGIFLIFGALHHGKFLIWAAVSFGLYLMDHIFRWIFGNYPQKINTIQVRGKEDNKLLRVTFPKQQYMEKFDRYRVGQYCFVNFPSVSLLEWHPFSLCASPHSTELEINVKHLGNYTKELIQRTEAGNPPKWIRIDGPYGKLKTNWREYTEIVILCGGIGITPTLSLLKDIYCVENQKGFGSLKRVQFIWSISKASSYEWFSDEIQSFQTNKPSVPLFTKTIHCTEKQMVENKELSQGRPKVKEVIKSRAHTLRVEEKMLVFVSGRSSMVTDAWDACKSEKRKGSRISFHKESFQL